MKFIPYAKLTALGFVCALSITPAAAQTAGTMTPAPGSSGIMPTAASPASGPGATLSKSVEFSTVAAAAAHCPDSTVVWSSLTKSHSFHASGSRYYGKTKHGAYVCKSDALAAGFHQAKS